MYVCGLSGAMKNAVAKLNVLFRDRVHYCDLAETPVSHTSFTAFTVAISLNGRHYIGVAKTKKAARNAAAERALIHLGMWTDDDEFAKATVTTEVDDDPVEAVYRIRDAIFRERQMHSSDQGGWHKSQWQQSHWNPEVWAGNGGNWGGARAAGRGWTGQVDPVPGEWSDQGPGVRHWDHPGRGGSFDGRRGRGRPGTSRGRGFRGGSVLDPFHRNIVTSNTNSGSLFPTNSWNKGDQDSSVRGPSGKTLESRPVSLVQTPNVSASPSMFHSQLTSGPPAVPLAQFPSASGHFSTPVSTSSPWSFAVHPVSGIYQPSTNQNQAAVLSPVQPSASYLPTGSNFQADAMSPASTFPSSYGGGFVQPWSHVQNTGTTGTLPAYGSYGETGYNWMYSQGSYAPF